ncbi:ABC transporter substrate-binding protein [Streptomyces sp. MMS24-I2-30]|uniref:ABC transporter substrate-binding protein n=1 Tax=Streptomyces sp. MMS24-I2-30 TaxID=3351564 RepID=UPI003896E7E9
MRISASRTVKYVATAVAATLSLTSLTACGGSGSGGSDSKSLQMWTFKQSHVQALRNAAKEFKKETGISVSVEAFTPEEAYMTKVQSAAKTGDLPDVLEVHSDGEDRVLGASGIAADLKDDYKGAWLDRIQSSVHDSGLVTPERYEKSRSSKSTDNGIEKGARYSVPLTIGTFGIVYANKAKLAEAGIKEAPKTWEDLLAALKATTAKDPKNGGLTTGLKARGPGLNWILQPLAFAQLGKEGYDNLFGKDKSSDFGSPNGVKALSLYDQLTPYWTPGTQSLDVDQADQTFAQGKAAFDVGGTFTLAFLQQNGMKPDDVYALGLPAPENGAVTDLSLAPMALTGMTLNSASKQPENAKKWMEFLSGKQVAAQFATDATDLPATDLGADSAKALGPTLDSMFQTFKGTPETTYDANLNQDIQAPGYEQNDVGDILADLTPLKRASVEDTARKISELNQSYWKAAGQ